MVGGEGAVLTQLPDPAAGSPIAAAPGSSWAARVELGLADVLDLRAAQVVPLGVEPTGPTLSLAPVKVALPDPIQAFTGLRLDGPHASTCISAGGSESLGERVPRSAESLTGPSATRLTIGAEFLVEPIDEDFWCYLRVLDVAIDRVELEVASVPQSLAALQRSPADLRVSSTGGVFRLRWESPASAPRATYRVRRRLAVVAPPADGRDGVKKGSTLERPRPRWETLALVQGGEFTDENAPWGEVVHYEVVRTDEAGDVVPGQLGRVIRAARVDTPGEWALRVETGSRVDLVSGRVVGPDDLAHIELYSGAAGAFALKPVGEVRFALEQKSAIVNDRRWWLPPGSDRRFVPGRTTTVAMGGELQFQLPDGTLGRLTLEELDGSTCRLRRQLSLEGDRLLPRPPSLSPEVVRAGGESLLLQFAELDRQSGVDGHRVVVVVEKETAFGQGNWSILGETTAGARSIELSRLLNTTAPVVRLRFRHRLTSGGLSHPSLPLDLLPEGDTEERRAALLEAALASIGAEDFQRRLDARGVLLVLAEEARAPLIEVAREERSPRALAAQSILEAIESADRGGAGLVRRIRQRALELASEAPRLRALTEGARSELFEALAPSLRSEHPGERLHGLLRFVDRAERGVLRAEGQPGDLRDDCEVARVWALAFAQTEPDPGTSKLAGFVAALGVVPSMASFEAERPAFLPDGTSLAGESPLPGASWTDLPGAAEELAWQLESRPELADLDLGPPLAQLLHRLRTASGIQGQWGGESDARLFDYDVRTAELVLRLVQRAQTSTDPGPLLKAAVGLAGGEAVELLARREVSDRRLASPVEKESRRRVVLLEKPSLELLEAALGEAVDRELLDGPVDGAAGVDILLPSGVYEDSSGAPLRTLEVLGSGVRLMPASPGGEVELKVALRVRSARNVVLQDLALTSEASTAINVLEGGHVVLLRSTIAGAGTVVFLQHSDLEMTESRVVGALSGKAPQWAIRELGRCRMFIRASYLNAGSLYLSDESENSMDRSVLDAGPRTLIQSPRAGHLVARECLLRGSNMGLYHVDRGVLAGVVIDVPKDPLGRQPGGLRVGSRFFHLVGEGQLLPPSMRLEIEPLQPR